MSPSQSEPEPHPERRAPHHITVDHPFTWPKHNKQEKLKIQLNQTTTNLDVKKQVATALGYLADDLTIHNTAGNKLNDNQPFNKTNQHITVKTRHRFQNQDQVQREHPLPRSDVLCNIHRSNFTLQCVEKLPRKPVLLRILQLNKGILPDPRTGACCLSDCPQVPEIIPLLTKLGALDQSHSEPYSSCAASVDNGFELEADFDDGDCYFNYDVLDYPTPAAAAVAAATAAAAAACAVNEPAKPCAPAVIAAAIAAASKPAPSVSWKHKYCDDFENALCDDIDRSADDNGLDDILGIIVGDDTTGETCGASLSRMGSRNSSYTDIKAALGSLSPAPLWKSPVATLTACRAGSPNCFTLDDLEGLVTSGDDIQKDINPKKRSRGEMDDRSDCGSNSSSMGTATTAELSVAEVEPARRSTQKVFS